MEEEPVMKLARKRKRAHSLAAEQATATAAAVAEGGIFNSTNDGDGGQRNGHAPTVREASASRSDTLYSIQKTGGAHRGGRVGFRLAGGGVVGGAPPTEIESGWCIAHVDREIYRAVRAGVNLYGGSRLGWILTQSTHCASQFPIDSSPRKLYYVTFATTN